MRGCHMFLIDRKNYLETPAAAVATAAKEKKGRKSDDNK
jgi:hypothetical protein